MENHEKGFFRGITRGDGDGVNKKALLLRRGFSEHDIDTDFASYVGDWLINTITKEEVIAATTHEELSKLFMKDSVDIRFTSTLGDPRFDTFADNIPEFKVPPSMLDPYIARLVKAINEIGVITLMSCDGWHNDSAGGRMKLWMKDRYSVLWFWLITEHIFGENWDRSRPYYYDWSNIWEPDYDEYQNHNTFICRMTYGKESEVYDKNHRYAVFIEKHKDEFLDIRNSLVSGLRRMEDSGEIGMIDRTGFLELRRKMENIFLPLSVDLREKFRYRTGY